MEKKRVLYFEKVKKWLDEEKYSVIKDTLLVEKILEIMESLEGELIDVQIEPNYWNDTSKIIIKSDKKNFLKFVKSFTTEFKDFIKNIEFNLR